MRPIWNIWYSYVGRRDQQNEVVFMNYGFSGEKKLELDAQDEVNRFSIGLYDHVARGVPLKGKRVLEIGCGRGGGCSYIARYLEPESVTGVDLCKKSIDFSKAHHNLENLVFKKMDAQNLTFPDNAFDAVINVESSHCYENMDRFLREVHRVLKPQGHFLYADLREKKHVSLLQEQLDNSELAIVEHEDITGNISLALEKDSQRRSDLIGRMAPRYLIGIAKHFAGVRGSRTYDAFKSRGKEYHSWILKKA